MKCTSAIRQLAYDTSPDALDEYLQMGEHCARDCLDCFTMCIIDLFTPEFLRKPDVNDVKILYDAHNRIHGLSSLIGSIDCANNDLIVLNHSPLFDDLLDDIALVVLFEVNKVTFKKDHKPTILNCPGATHKKRKAFRFANYTTEKEEFLDIVKAGWCHDIKGVSNLKKKLDVAQIAVDNDPHNLVLRGEVVNVLEEYTEALKNEEELLVQKAKV
nr:putative harbinger transposase-derived protein [Tanacetum cinerariifolium]